MPKIEINYSDTIIYKIVCKDTSIKDIYIGYTTNFVQRKHTHKQHCANIKLPNYNCKLYKTIRNNGGWINWKMIIIDKINCKDSFDAKQTAVKYITLFNATLNDTIQTQTQTQTQGQTQTQTQKYKIENTQSKTNNILIGSNLINLHDNIVNNEKSETKYKFCCKNCSFYTDKMTDWSRHLSTTKHKNINMNGNIYDTVIDMGSKNNQEEVSKQNVCKCGKTYIYASGLCKHKKYCTKDVTTNILNIINNDDMIKNFLFEQNKQIIDKLTEQNNKLIEQNTKLMLFAETNKTNIISNNIINNNFNLNVFLNEKCKDAINITDFVDSLVLGINDLEETARLGYVNGISKIFINGLKKLDIYKRPLHCSDIKRNTLYIKDDNQWAKENNDKPTLTKAIKKVSTKNIQNIFEWQKLNPYYTDSHSKQNDKYNKIICETMSGSSKEEQLNNYDKIIKNVIKEVVIDKE